MAESKEQRTGRDGEKPFSAMDAFGKTADVMIALEPGTGVLMKGAELAWRYLDRQIREEGRR